MRLLKRVLYLVAGGVLMVSSTASTCWNPLDRAVEARDENVDVQPGSASQIPVRKTAAGHPIQYFISVPRGWPGNRKWPVVMTLAGAGKDWEGNAQSFAHYRDSLNLPFIIVTPVILTNGGDGAIPRDHPRYQYPSSTWDMLDSVGRCAFDMAGVEAVIADVQNIYSGDGKPFLTAFSGGGHQGWATVLLHPEWLRAAALVGTNFSGRCVSKETKVLQLISRAPQRVLLPVRNFNGADDSNIKNSAPQQLRAMGIARENGYATVSEETVRGVGHDPMPKIALSYFATLLRPDER